MTSTLHLDQRVTHPEHGPGIVETILSDSRRCLGGGRGVDVFIRRDSDGAVVIVCADDLRDEADDDRR